MEVLNFNEDLRTAIAEGASMAELRRIAREGGMIGFRDYAKYLLTRGLTTPDEVLRVLYLEEDPDRVIEKMIQCGQCNHKNTPNHSFCEECGADIRQQA
jgi:hypothetical protein